MSPYGQSRLFSVPRPQLKEQNLAGKLQAVNLYTASLDACISIS